MVRERAEGQVHAEERARADAVLLDPSPALDQFQAKTTVHEPLVAATAS